MFKGEVAFLTSQQCLQTWVPQRPRDTVAPIHFLQANPLSRKFHLCLFLPSLPLPCYHWSCGAQCASAVYHGRLPE